MNEINKPYTEEELAALKANFKNSDSITDKQIEEAIDRVILEGKSLTMENVIQTLSGMKPKTNEMSMM
ncbi:hypothetical protein MSH26_05250 [bacterium]|nr:hypothetical protein [bacterium]MDY3757658.1 hypothetical protein [Bacilli bacterium]